VGASLHRWCKTVHNVKTDTAYFFHPFSAFLFVVIVLELEVGEMTEEVRREEVEIKDIGVASRSPLEITELQVVILSDIHYFLDQLLDIFGRFTENEPAESLRLFASKMERMELWEVGRANRARLTCGLGGCGRTRARLGLSGRRCLRPRRRGNTSSDARRAARVRRHCNINLYGQRYNNAINCSNFFRML
jgi:hypothetical protein